MKWGATAVALLVVLVAVIGPLFGDAPNATVGAPFGHSGLLGTDVLGRDVLARVLHGGLAVVGLAAGATLVTVIVGAGVGMLLGLAGDRLSELTTRVIDLVLVFPPLLVMLVLAAGFPGSDLAVMVAVALTTVPFSVRVVRAATQKVAATGYLRIARARGDSVAQLIRYDVLPNVRGVVLADSGLRFVTAVYLTSTAGFLGLGRGAPAANWGRMVSENLPGITLSPWPVLAPALLLVAFGVSVNLLLGGSR
ncbi:ABC transporter permease [Kibdelosporangium aridum]|uniref:Peptide/nickel transport system permease protein n=1 Tax=Kibdelosporangium aridum TaxID=2030 RepID=A0A1W2BLK9_KIBAR|nr:ABC transporter permease [Kibdelosporangium aridum]SMC73746.1 peptide/nickel transport system permease protein [Kibdelosporangium aridum]